MSLGMLSVSRGRGGAMARDHYLEEGKFMKFLEERAELILDAAFELED